MTIPGSVSGYLDRTALTQKCMPTNRRLTVLKAPGGFGKTTLLAKCCRELAEQGVPTAWFALDARDEPASLDTFIVQAFQRAGLENLQTLSTGGDGFRDQHDRISELLRALDSHGGPWVLALDELETVTSRESVALLNSILRSAPSSLHIAMACRELPVGLDITGPLFEGAGEMLTDEDLRFSKSEIERFFDLKLSRRELAAVVAESAGWPIALRIHLTARIQQSRERDVREVVDNWVESRLWSDLAPDDRRLLLDVGLFDWFDGELLEEVLDVRGLMRRLESMSGVAGLLEPVRGSGGKAWRLHSLIRGHCTERRRRESPERYRRLHRSIASALARRGETTEAMKHAAEAADAALVGRIMVQAGGVQLWLRKGVDGLLAADRYVTGEVLDLHPRLAFARAVAQTFKGRSVQAKQTLDAAMRDMSAVGPGGDRGSEGERWLAQGTLALHGCVSVGSEAAEEVLADCKRMLDSPGVDPVMRGTMEVGLCMVHNIKGEFDAALERGERARRWFGGRSPYMALALDVQFGLVAMAQGRVKEAADLYEKCARAANRKFLDDPRLKVIAEVLIRELNLERNRIGDADQGIVATSEMLGYGAQLAFHAAAITVAVELTLQTLGIDSALSMVDEMWEHALQGERSAVSRYVAGLRVAVLGLAERVGEAEQRWRIDVLPESDAGCLDLGSQSWREMEVLSCARLRLLAVRGEFGPARALLQQLIALAGERGLRRTWMRALVLGIVLEEVAGDRRAGLRHLTAFLQLFAETDYAWPAARERLVMEPMLTAFLDGNPNASLQASAKALLTELEADTYLVAPLLNDREVNVLARLEKQTDRQIATELGLTPEGVRYHIRKLFDKLEVRNRFDGVHRARALGLLPSE